MQRGDGGLVLLLRGLLLLHVLVDRLQLGQELVENRDRHCICALVDAAADRVDQRSDRRLLRMLPFLKLLDLRHGGVIGADTRLPFRYRLLRLAPKRRDLLAQGIRIGEQAVDRWLGLGGIRRVDFAQCTLVARHQRVAAPGERVVAGLLSVGRRVLQMCRHRVHQLLERCLQLLRLGVGSHLRRVAHAPLRLQAAAHRCPLEAAAVMPAPCAGR